MSITKQIKNRISDMNDGTIFVTTDFADISNITTVRKCLGRYVEEGTIQRIFDGIYIKPVYSSLLQTYLPANPDDVAYVLARKFHWNIAPTGDIALNRMGLSTQVPAVWSFVSDGPYREFKWDNITLEFRHRTNREISNLSYTTLLLTESIRSLGKNHVNDSIIEKLKVTIPEEDRKVILNEASACSEWIYEIVRKVCTD